MYGPGRWRKPACDSPHHQEKMPTRQGAVTARVRYLQSRMRYASRARTMIPRLHDKLAMVPMNVRCFTSVHSIPCQEVRKIGQD